MDDIYIYNPTNKEVHVKVFGNHFSFKPNQMKRMRHEIGDFMSKEKGYLGLVGLPAQFDDPEFKNSEEGQRILESKKEEGINKRVRHLLGIVHNLQVSLKTDLDKANIKADIYTYASSGEVKAMEELTELQRLGEDKEKAKIEHLRKLERQLKANSNALANRKAD